MKKTKKEILEIGVKKMEITDDLVKYYKKNPKELDLIVDKEEFHINFLLFFFSLGLTLTIGSRILEFTFENVWGKFLNNVVLDVASELGIAIFGGTVTAYIIEYLQKKQYKENMLFRNEIKKRIKEME